MLYAGCDLHKQTITICVVNQMRTVILPKTLACADEEALRRFFEELRQREPFTVVVEAIAIWGCNCSNQAEFSLFPDQMITGCWR